MKSLFRIGLWKTAKTFYCLDLWRMVRKVWEAMKLRRDRRPDGKFCGGRDSGPPLSLALTHPPAPWQALSSSPFFSGLELLLPAVPATFRSPALTHPWKRPLFCSCWSRMFSSFSGLGMKPISQPSFTRRPIHQSLLNFYRYCQKWSRSK